MSMNAVWIPIAHLLPQVHLEVARARLGACGPAVTSAPDKAIGHMKRGAWPHAIDTRHDELVRELMPRVQDPLRAATEGKREDAGLWRVLRRK